MASVSMVQGAVLEETKLCLRCGPERGPLPRSAFHPHGSTKDRLQNECKTCRNARRQEARKAKRGSYATERDRYHDTHLVACRESYYRAKEKVFTHYGKTCVECGYADMRALSIDHVDSGGSAHRRALKGQNFYRWLVREGYPSGFQTLCMNCQFIKRHAQHEFKPFVLPPEPTEFRS